MNGFDEAKRENKIVAGWLLYYEDRKRGYEKRLEEILLGGQHSGVVAVNDGAGMGDGTGNKAARLADELAETKAWLDLVEEGQQKLPWKMQVFLEVRRECRYGRGGRVGRPAWVPYVQRRYAEKVAKRSGKQEEDVWISKPETLFLWWQRIVDYAARLAAKRGLL